MAAVALPATTRSKVDHIARSQSDATQFRIRTVGGTSSFEAAGLFATDAQDQGRPNYNFGRTLQQGSLSYAHAGDLGVRQPLPRAIHVVVDQPAQVFGYK